MDLIITLTGFFVGLLVGITGVGGGAIMTPALIYGFGVPAWIAVGTDLLFAAITKSVGVFAHARQKTIDWLVVLRLAAGSLPGAGLALFVISELHLAEEELNQIINSFLGVALLLTSLVLLFKPRANKNYFSDHTRNRLTVIAGFILGLLVTFSSVGAGALGVAVLTLLYPAMQTSRLVGTDLAHAIPLTLVAGLGHWSLGGVDLNLLAALLVGSIPGIYLGSRLGLKISQELSRRLIGSVLALLGFKFIF